MRIKQATALNCLIGMIIIPVFVILACNALDAEQATQISTNKAEKVNKAHTESILIQCPECGNEVQLITADRQWKIQCTCCRRETELYEDIDKLMHDWNNGILNYK